MEIYDRKLIEDSTASNSLVDHSHCNELLDRHLKSSSRFTATKNYLQPGRLLRKRDSDAGLSDKVAAGGRLRRRTKHYAFHSELTSSGGELQSSTYEEYRHLEVNETGDEEDSNLEEEEEDNESEDESESGEETEESESDVESEQESEEQESSDQASSQASSGQSSEQGSEQGSEQTSSGSQTNEESSSAYQEESDRTGRSSAGAKRPSQLVYEQKMNKTERVIYERRPPPPQRNLPAGTGQPVNSVHNVNSHVNRQQRPNTTKYNEKQYDKFHYKRNNQNYAFFRDESHHEPTCPLYSSQRALVSRK